MYVKLESGSIEQLRGKKLLLFGAGSLGVRSIEECQKVNADILGFVDNDRNRRGQQLNGYNIYAPEDIAAFPDAVLLITSTYVNEIKQQLKEMGVTQVEVIRLGALRDTIKPDAFFKPILGTENANELLYDRLMGDAPFFAGRLGSNELECMVEYYYLLHRDNGGTKAYHDNLKLVMKQGAGFYPTEDDYLDQFVIQYTKDLKQLDFVWSMWLSRFEDQLYQKYIPECPIGIYDDSALPYDLVHPWTKALEGKKVLVIHPFETSIVTNYKKREAFFDNPEVLPKFELQTLKAVQSIAEEQPDYATWFDALKYMENEIAKREFDIALIGAGAYGFPLGAYVKRLGKKAVHIGGMLQLLFGIKGKAWNKLGIYKEAWTQPLAKEHPAGYRTVEAGRYW